MLYALSPRCYFVFCARFVLSEILAAGVPSASVGPLCARAQPRRDAGGPKERRSQGLRMFCGRFAPPVRRGRLFRAHQRPPSIASCSLCASAGSSSHCMIAPHQRLQVRSRWLFRPGQRSSGCGVLQKQGRRRVFGHTQAPVSPEPRGDVHESEGLAQRVGSSALHGRTYTRPAAHRPPPLRCRGGLVRLWAGGVVCSGADRAAAGGGGRGRGAATPRPSREGGGERRHAALLPTFGRPERD